MTNEEQNVFLSQLADGELGSDEATSLLLAAFDDPELLQKLKEMLRLRQATAAWRAQQPSRPVMVVTAAPSRAVRGWRFGRRLGGYAAAACFGGLMVLAGFWAAGAGRPDQPGSLTAMPVTAERMQEVARVFALHESVAGPLAWYAADDQNIRVASAEGDDADNRPVAVLLKIEPERAGGAARTYVIVCRERQSAAIDLPDDLPGASGLKVYLAPKAVNGWIDMQYAIAVAGQNGGPVTATLSGQRRVGLTETSLGQLALSDRLFNVQVAAWPIRESVN